MNQSDTDCNRVAYWPHHPNLTDRCAMPEGHEGNCWRDVEMMRHKHRKPTHTFTDPFDVVPRGGKHRRPSLRETIEAVNRCNRDLAERVARAVGKLA